MVFVIWSSEHWASSCERLWFLLLSQAFNSLQKFIFYNSILYDVNSFNSKIAHLLMLDLDGIIIFNHIVIILVFIFIMVMVVMLLLVFFLVLVQRLRNRKSKCLGKILGSWRFLHDRGLRLILSWLSGISNWLDLSLNSNIDNCIFD